MLNYVLNLIQDDIAFNMRQSNLQLILIIL